MTSCLKSFGAATVLLCFSLCGRGDEPAKPKPREAPPLQPIPFSHKTHTQLDLRCEDCHEMAGPGWDMTYPAEAKCIECHSSIRTESPAIIKLMGYYQEHKPVPWAQIYTIPDYVLFSHRDHYKKAKISCETCHGPVATRDVITKERPTSMVACVDCHRERGAPVTCNFCHNPNP